jgi:hypothetical protein
VSAHKASILAAQTRALTLCVSSHTYILTCSSKKNERFVLRPIILRKRACEQQNTRSIRFATSQRQFPSCRFQELRRAVVLCTVERSILKNVERESLTASEVVPHASRDQGHSGQRRACGLRDLDFGHCSCSWGSERKELLPFLKQVIMRPRCECIIAADATFMTCRAQHTGHSLRRSLKHRQPISAPTLNRHRHPDAQHFAAVTSRCKLATWNWPGSTISSSSISKPTRCTAGTAKALAASSGALPGGTPCKPWCVALRCRVLVLFAAHCPFSAGALLLALCGRCT